MWSRNAVFSMAACSLVFIASGCSKADGDSKSSAVTEVTEGVLHVEPVHVTDATFAELVENAEEEVVVVEFWAPWCGPCRRIAPILEKLSSEFAGKVKVAKVDVDDNPNLSGRFRIESIPAVIMFRKGKQMDVKIGAMRENDYRAWFKEGLKG